MRLRAVLHILANPAAGAARLLPILMFAAFLAFLAGLKSVEAQVTPAEAEQAADAALLQPDIPTDELAYLLVPLTKAELEPLAKAWQGIVRATTEEISEGQVALLRNPDLRTDETNRDLGRLTERRAGQFERFSMVVDALDRKGGDTELLAELRAYRNSVLFDETTLASPKAIASAVLIWLSRADGGLRVLLQMGIVVLAFAALLLVSRSARGLARRWVGRAPNLSRLLQAFLVAAVYWVVLVIGLLFVLAALGVNITPLFAMIGGASFILAFAFQDTLGNLASGLMIMINRPFDEGDYVLVGGVGGTVKSVSIVATTVTTPDNQVIVIPNKNVWGNVITNVTASDTRRVDLVFGISYEDSIPEALRVIEETVRAHPAVLEDPEPTIRVHELAASSVNFICRPWVNTADYWSVYWDLTQRMKEAFNAAGISIPYPQQDVHVRKVLND